MDVLHGVNFDVLERRDAAQYGGVKLMELEVRVQGFARELGLEATFYQSNHEGSLIDRLEVLDFDAVVINPGALGHTSYALRDAIEGIERPVVPAGIGNAPADIAGAQFPQVAVGPTNRRLQHDMETVETNSKWHLNAPHDGGLHVVECNFEARDIGDSDHAGTLVAASATAQAPADSPPHV